MIQTKLSCTILQATGFLYFSPFFACSVTINIFQIDLGESTGFRFPIYLIFKWDYYPYHGISILKIFFLFRQYEM